MLSVARRSTGLANGTSASGLRIPNRKKNSSCVGLWGEALAGCYNAVGTQRRWCGSYARTLLKEQRVLGALPLLSSARPTRRQRKLQLERPSSSEACLTNKGTYSRKEGTGSACLVRKDDGETELVGGMLEKRAQLVEDA